MNAVSSGHVQSEADSMLAVPLRIGRETKGNDQTTVGEAEKDARDLSEMANAAC